MYRLDEIRNILLNELFNNSIFPTLNTKSLQVVNWIKRKNIDRYSNLNFEVSTILEIIEKGNHLNATTRREKFYNNSSLFNLLTSIFNNPNTNLTEKQVLIEQSLMKYELNYLDNNFDNPNIDNKILQDIYKKND